MSQRLESAEWRFQILHQRRCLVIFFQMLKVQIDFLDLEVVLALVVVLQGLSLFLELMACPSRAVVCQLLHVGRCIGYLVILCMMDMSVLAELFRGLASILHGRCVCR